MRKWAKPFVAAVLILTLVGSTTTCHPRMIQLLAAGLIFTAAVATLVHHDAHFHDHQCGHPYVEIDDREVYHYQDRWEYYDENTGEWYYYEEDPVPDETVEEHYYYYNNY